MKITYLHQYFNTPNMAGGTRSYEMARRLVAAGHDVTVVTSWRSDEKTVPVCSVSYVDGIKVYWLRVTYSNRLSFIRRVAAFAKFALAASRRARSLEADLVFATSTPLTIAIPAVLAARKWRVPMVFEVRDLWPELPIAVGALKNPLIIAGARWLERFAYRNSALVVALSPGMKAGVVRTGYPESRVSVIPNSADLAQFDPTKTDVLRFRRSVPDLGQRPLVIYAGTFGKINGIVYLARVAAAAKGRGDDIGFMAIGDGAEEELLREEAMRLGILGNNFWMVSSMPKRDMPNILASADLACSFFVNLEAMWANSANKFFDGLASGTPLAINYGGWQAELLRKHKAGIVLPPDDPDTAATLIADFLQNPERVRAAGTAARILAERQFSRDKLAKELEDVLVSATGARTGR